MAVLDTAIHLFLTPPKQVVDGRNNSGHDVEGLSKRPSYGARITNRTLVGQAAVSQLV